MSDPSRPLWQWSACDLAEAIAARKVTAVEAVGAAVARMPVIGSDPKLQILQDFPKIVAFYGYPGPSTTPIQEIVNTFVFPDMPAAPSSPLVSHRRWPWMVTSRGATSWKSASNVVFVEGTITPIRLRNVIAYSSSSIMVSSRRRAR